MPERSAAGGRRASVRLKSKHVEVAARDAGIDPVAIVTSPPPSSHNLATQSEQGTSPTGNTSENALGARIDDDSPCVKRHKRQTLRTSASVIPESPQCSVSKRRAAIKAPSLGPSDCEVEPKVANSAPKRKAGCSKRKHSQKDTPLMLSVPEDPWSFDVDGFNDFAAIPDPRLKDVCTESATLLCRAYSISSTDPPIIHAKKASEIAAWLDCVGRPADARPGRILVVKGPAGCGKSATLRALCAARGIDLVDSLCCTDSTLRSSHAALVSNEARYSALSMVTELDDHDMFAPESMDRACASRRVAVFESLPHPAAAEAIAALSLRVPSDTVLVVTSPCGDADRGDDACEVAISRVCRAPFTTTITLNSIAPTFMRRLGLDQVSVGDGDACAALVSKAMAAICASARDVLSTRDAPINIFHALGRVLYVRGAKERVDVDALASSDRPSFHDALHANYPRFLSSVQSLAAIADALSEAGAVPWPAAIHPGLDSYMALPERTAAYAVATSAAHGAAPYRFSPMEGPRRFRPERRVFSRDELDLHVSFNWTP